MKISVLRQVCPRRLTSPGGPLAKQLPVFSQTVGTGGPSAVMGPRHLSAYRPPPAQTMTAARMAAETIEFRCGCGSGDGSSFQQSADRSPRPREWLLISRNNSICRAVATAFSGPQAGARASKLNDQRGRPSQRIAPVAANDCAAEACRHGRRAGARHWPLWGALSYPSAGIGERASPYRQRRPMWMLVASNSARRGQRSRRRSLLPRRTSNRAYKMASSTCSTSNGHD
jgi:hypothetical protein